jgi:hypothetical protein
MSNDTLSVLGQNKRASYEGDFVFGLDSVSGKGTAVDEGFGHVHKHWYKQTKSYEQGFEELAKGKAETEDIVCSLADMVATVDDTGKFCFKYLDGRLFYPTLHAIQQAGTKFGTGTWYAEQLYNRASKGDGDALAFAFQHGKVMLQAEINKSKRMQKEYLFRTRIDGSLRAVMTAGYAIIDNRWFMEIIKSIIPGGRLSHWRGDSDTIYGNILIPDSIREEDDSDYGGMVSLSNCEIGIRSMLNLPSVFRAICMNGCIWNQETGKGIKQVHRGKLDLVALKAKITENIEKQIPLLPQGIQRILGIRAFKDDINIKPLVGQLALDYKFGKSQATAIIKAYGEEARQTPQYRGTLFNLVNAVTRAGQTFSNSEWVNADMVGGELVNFDKSDWESLTGRASRLKADVVDELFASAN